MSKPNLEAEKQDFFHQLHLDAGLADGGQDDEGNQLYIGSDKEWERFTELYDNYLNS